MTLNYYYLRGLCFLFTYAYILLSYGQCDREQMVDEYEEHFLGSNVTTSDLGWTGNEKDCISGDISPLAREKTLQRINYYRRLAKVPTEVAFDPELSKMCQDAAVIMHSNNDLSHSPTEGWSCYTEEGKLAAGKSNLALGAHTSAAIALYMIDPGTNNAAVGHRRWILFSRADTFGMGSTSRAHALYVVHTKAPAPADLDYVAYPSAGFFPAPLVPDRWSLSVPKAKFDDVDVKMYDESGMEIPLEILEYKSGFGDNTIVWEPERSRIEKFSPYDHKYRVIVSNVKQQDEIREIEYEVIIAKPEYPPNCGEGFYWSSDDCNCINESTTPSYETGYDQELFVIRPNLADNYLKIERAGQSDIEPAQLFIFDFHGKVILQELIQSELHVDTKNYAPGFYFARLKTKSTWSSRKFTVVH